MWLVSPHNHHNKVSEKVTNSVLDVQTPRNNTVASLSILREQGTPTPLPGPGYQQSQEWGPRRSWDRRSSERARVETVVAPVTPVAAVSVAPEPPEAADISRSRSRRDVEEDPSWLRLSERWSLQRDRSQWECQCRSCHTCWCRSWTEYLVSTLAREPQSGSGSSGHSLSCLARVQASSLSPAMSRWESGYTVHGEKFARQKMQLKLVPMEDSHNNNPLLSFHLSPNSEK